MISCRLAKDANTVGLWNFTEGSGTIIKDYSGNGNNGTLTNFPVSPWVNNTPIGGGLTYDGTDDYINIPNNSLYNFGTGDFSLEIVIKILQDIPLNTQNLILTTCVAGEYELGCFLLNVIGWGSTVVTTSGISFKIPTSSSTTVSTEVGNILNKNQYYYVVYTRSGTTCCCYIDGVIKTSKTDVGIGTSISTTNPLRICGANIAGWSDIYTNIQIAQLRLSNKVRSAAEIKHNWFRMAQVIES